MPISPRRWSSADFVRKGSAAALPGAPCKIRDWHNDGGALEKFVQGRGVIVKYVDLRL